MRYSITNQHINFYIEHGYIEFEELISEDLFISCQKEYETLTHAQDSKTVYLKGRDIWRSSLPFQTLAKNKSIASIVQQLNKQSRLRLAFDQISVSNLDEKKPLESFFSFQGLVCIVVFYLDKKENSCSFVHPKHPFLSKEDSTCTYMIGYSSEKALYKSNEQDVNNHFLKKFGYAFGDPLKEEFHPIVCWE